MENTMQTVQISREDMETIVQTEEQSEDVLLELTSASFDVICRACLNQQELFNIAEVHWDEVWLKDMLHDLFRPKEKIEKNLPQKMCQNCIEDLFVVKQFLERYHSSTKILLDTLKNETSNEEEEAYYVVVEPPPTEILTDSTETKTETIQMLKTNPVNPNVKENTTQNIKDIEETIAQTEVTENTSLVEYSVEDKNIKEETEEKVNNELNMKNDDLSQQFENEDQTEDQTHGDVIKDEEESQVHYVHITEDQIHDDDGEDEDRNKTGFDDETAENLSSNVDNAETMIVSDKSANDECDDKYQNQTVEIMDHPAKIIDQPAEIIRISSSQVLDSVKTKSNVEALNIEDVWYMCSNCDEPFDDYLKLQRHKNKENHKDVQIYVCPFPACGSRYKLHTLFVEHFQNHLETNTYSCILCDQNFTNRRLLSAHLRSTHGTQTIDTHINYNTFGNKHACAFCTKTFKRKSHLDFHLKKHTREKTKCSYCDKLYSPYSLYVHEQKHKIALGLVAPKPKKQKEPGSLPEFQCHLCSLVLSSKHCLEVHIKRHGPKNYKCNQCPATYSCEEGWQAHVNLKHIDGDFSCPFCQENFRQKYFLEQHQKSEHPGEKLNLFSCEICSKNFSNSISYNEHVKVHKGQTKHYCSSCNKYFVSESKLSRHIRSHTGEKPYRCGICAKQFSSKDYFKCHVENHKKTGQNPFEMKDPLEVEGMEVVNYPCDYCHAAFVDEDDLAQHLQEEHLNEATEVEMVE